MEIKFWGVRGSIPTPISTNMKTGGHTACIEVRTCDDIIIFDAGTGIIPLGKHLLQEFQGKTLPHIHLFLSHTHWDHLYGFIFFELLFQKDANISIYCPQKPNRTLYQLMITIMNENFCPIDFDTLPANIQLYDIPEGSITLPNNATIISQKHQHPGGAYSYRVEYQDKSFVFHTDIEHSSCSLDNRVVNFSKNADLMIHDAQYIEEEMTSCTGWGHSTWQQAIGVANRSDVKMLGFFHHDPNRSDKEINKLEKQAQKKFTNSFFCREGMSINL